MPELVFWVKFRNLHIPERWVRKDFEQFWHDLREFMMKNRTGEIEWIIRD